MVYFFSIFHVYVYASPVSNFETCALSVDSLNTLKSNTWLWNSFILFRSPRVFFSFFIQLVRCAKHIQVDSWNVFCVVISTRLSGIMSAFCCAKPDTESWSRSVRSEIQAVRYRVTTICPIYLLCFVLQKASQKLGPTVNMSDLICMSRDCKFAHNMLTHNHNNKERLDLETVSYPRRFQAVSQLGEDKGKVIVAWLSKSAVCKCLGATGNRHEA